MKHVLIDALSTDTKRVLNVSPRVVLFTEVFHPVKVIQGTLVIKDYAKCPHQN